jgi:hypothetical protein
MKIELKEKIKGSQLISVFMLPLRSVVIPNYHEDWNKLMPVYKKIRDYMQDIARPSKNHCCQGDVIAVDIQVSVMSIDIENAFKYIVQFIEWYNNQTVNK